MSAVGDARERLTEAAAPDAGTDVEAGDSLAEYVEDAMTFAIGAAAEVEIGVRKPFHGVDLAAEFMEARRTLWLAAHDAALIAAAEARGAAEAGERIADVVTEFATAIAPAYTTGREAGAALVVFLRMMTNLVPTAPATDSTEATPGGGS